MSPLKAILARLPSSRILLAGAAATLVTLPAMAPAMANTQRCATTVERSALDIRALQSQLMVLAITCGQHDDYNRFVTQNRTVLGAAYNDVRRHFQRTHGGAAQRELDAYITNTANGHSQVGISQGSLFCSNQAQLFPAALGVTGRDALANLSRERQISQVYSPDTCPGPRQPATRSATQQTPPRPAQSQPAAQQPRSQSQQPARTQQTTRTAQAQPR